MQSRATDGFACDIGPLPRSLGGWFPFLWSRVLFGGAPALAPTACRVCSLVVLLVVPAVLLYPCLSFDLFEPDESRYAEIPREMLQRGEVVVPYLQGEVYVDKPPLLYWLVETSYRVFGVRVWAARLVPALAVHACVLLLYLLGRRSLGERAAFAGAMLLALSPGYLGMGRLLLMDGVLTLWSTLALLAAFEAVRGPRLAWSWWLVSAAACGLGVLTKGPVAVVLLLPPVWLYRRLGGRGVAPAWRGWGAFAAVLLGVTLPWYAAMCVRVPSFARDFFWEHNVQRFLAPFAHQHGVWFYIPVLLAGLLPGTLLAWPFARFLGGNDPTTARLRSPELGFMLLASGWCVFFFTLSACKLPTYVLPAFPPLTLALGYFIAHSRWAESRAPRAVAITTFVLLLFAHAVALPWYAAYRSPLAKPQEVTRLCGDRGQPVVCYPRNCDSVSFYLGRDDLRCYRSKDIEDLRALVRRLPRTVILCTHRHSLRGLHELLPPDVAIVHEVHLGLREIPGVPRGLMKPLLALMGETALGLCDVAVVENRR
jgi:4-amino-4-deoxy-L-arabinose transferase-like glycosyltransferase